MKRVMCALVLAAVLVPGSAEAQRRVHQNRFSFEPYAGVMKDAYDLEADGSDVGLLAGFRAGYQESQRLGLHADLSYAQTNDVGTRGLTGEAYDNQWVMLTAGISFALVPGNTSIAVGGDAGVAWRNVDRKDNGLETPGTDYSGWGTYDVVAPSLTLRHHFSQRTSLALTAKDLIFNVLEGDVEHSPALTLGLSFR